MGRRALSARLLTLRRWKRKSKRLLLAFGALTQRAPRGPGPVFELCLCVCVCDLQLQPSSMLLQ